MNFTNTQKQQQLLKKQNNASVFLPGMFGEAFRVPSSILPFPHEPNLNPNLQECHPPLPATAPSKKKRNLPGTPDPEAEVIALSPKTLMTPNRFVCEICNKGFQRDQNLQLHRRGHNLPWKLRQRPLGSGPARKRVYVCPEPSCVHHDPARALGDLTGIKKHFSRKHGEKKWKCERCGKRYAVQSDYKAHSKTCGTREYRCDCGTIFSRKDSFVTHRAFCDALTHETSTAAAAATDNDSLSYASDETPSGAPQKADLSLWLNRTEMPPLPFPPSAGYMSATALLQKAAQMGAKTSGATSSAFSGILRSMKGGSAGYLQGGGEMPMMGVGGGGMTRDFLGLGGEGGAGRNIQELTRFASLGSGMDFISNSSYNDAAG